MTTRPVIVGTGIAGLWTAWRLASEGQAAIVVTKETLADSASSWAQGGIAVALGPGDSPSQHAADTLAASDGLADPEAVRILTSEGPDRIYELLALGARFDRGTDGRLRFGLEAAHTRARIIHAGGDRTGAALIGCLAQVVRLHPLIELLEHTEVTSLLVHEERIAGVMALPRGGARYPIHAGAVVLATGGVGQLYAVTTNPKVATADGWALAHRIGAKLRDIEFLQFHPTALTLPGVNPAPLISEAVRGAGALLVDREGRRFALDADPRGELAPRDIVARAVAAAVAARRRLARRPVDRRLPGALPRHHGDAGAPRPRCRARSPAGGPGAPLRHGRHPDRPRGPGQPAGALGGGRGRLDRRARRQPARLQLAARGAGVRRPRRTLGDGRGARRNPGPIGGVGAGRRYAGHAAPTRPAARSGARCASS